MKQTAPHAKLYKILPDGSDNLDQEGELNRM